MTVSQAPIRAFVRRTTRPRPVDGLPDIRLHVADDVTSVSGAAGDLLDIADPDLAYWAFPWAGGLAIARYLVDHPAEVAGKRVLDVAAGSGLCAIVAARLGAAVCRAVDRDPFAEAAVELNARTNGVRVAFTLGDAANQALGDVDVILAGDVCYQEGMAREIVDGLRAAAACGIRVLVGDPGRRYLPPDLRLLATYVVRTSRELEPQEATPSGVYTFGPDPTQRARTASDAETEP